MTEIMRMEPGRLQIAGKFDSDHRHLRQSGGQRTVMMCFEQTIFPNGANGAVDWSGPTYVIGLNQYSCRRFWGAAWPQLSVTTSPITVGV